MAQPGADAPVAYDLRLSEIDEIRALTSELASAGADAGAEDFYRGAWELESCLPAGARRFLDEFRRFQPAAAALVWGLPVNDTEIGATPSDWRTAAHLKRGWARGIGPGAAGDGDG